jgi:hypothetical protein
MKYLFAVAAAAVLLVGSARANVIVYYDVTSLGGNSFQYDYRVVNGGNSSIGWLTMYLPTESLTPGFENVAVTSVQSPTGWDNFPMVPADTTLGLGAYLDWFSMGSTSDIGPGATLAGFSVTLQFQAGAFSSSQFYTYPPLSFDYNGSGMTDRPPTNQVPDQTGWLTWMLALGSLAALAWMNQPRLRLCRAR